MDPIRKFQISLVLMQVTAFLLGMLFNDALRKLERKGNERRNSEKD